MAKANLKNKIKTKKTITISVEDYEKLIVAEELLSKIIEMIEVEGVQEKKRKINRARVLKEMNHDLTKEYNKVDYECDYDFLMPSPSCLPRERNDFLNFATGPEKGEDETGLNDKGKGGGK